jgi:hypothetical protein
MNTPTIVGIVIMGLAIVGTIVFVYLLYRSREWEKGYNEHEQVIKNVYGEDYVILSREEYDDSVRHVLGIVKEELNRSKEQG